MVGVPQTVRGKALAVGAGWWLDDLPSLVASIERDWSITVGRTYDDATEAVVAQAVVDGGAPAVLKLLVPRDGDAASNEITVLCLTDGTGCVRLLRHDQARGVLLLERLGPSLYELALPIGRRHEILCLVAQRVWRLTVDFPPAPTRAGGWSSSSRRPGKISTVRARSAHSITRARASHRIDAHDDERAVLVHGDVHQWNTLQLVDPDLLVEADYDMSIVMREDPGSRWVATRTSGPGGWRRERASTQPPSGNGV